ncbi:hypothetical protein Vadar_032624 [Vaccinium darrowii]|uniref:Uncharacterized protein n=1 Tax=Vaccinium darrowii TaxID=229202 RepID=A0ACB7X5T8_9ERIC|nr:hypothetical protein Vadar_032624 [Vaccinium darrowii]
MEIQPDTSIPESDDFLCQFQGFWFAPSFLLGTQKLLKQFKPLPNDVILASFPKTGTTWLKSILYSILNRSSIDELTRNHPQLLVPQLELQVYGPDAISDPLFPSLDPSSPNRIFSTHLPYQIFRETVNSSDCRVVYIARNPKDTLVSGWHFLNTMETAKSSPLPIDESVDMFCEGKGKVGDHKNYLTKDMIDRVDTITREKFHGSIFKHEADSS